VGGAGPVLVAKLSEVVGLQRAMLLAPACYVVSGLLFLAAERAIEEQEKGRRAAKQLERAPPSASSAVAAQQAPQPPHAAPPAVAPQPPALDAGVKPAASDAAAQAAGIEK